MRLWGVGFAARDPGRLAAFWAEVLGWPIVPSDREGDDIVLAPPPVLRAPEPLKLVFRPSAPAFTARNAMSLRLAAGSDGVRRDVERWRRFGAQRRYVGRADDGWGRDWASFADPEGNDITLVESPTASRPEPAWPAISLDVADPEPPARFWAQAIGWRRIDLDRTEDRVALAAPSGSGPQLDLLRTSMRCSARYRLWLELATDPGDDPDEEAARLQALGAQLLDRRRGGSSRLVLRDPGGHEFCLLSSRHD